MHSLKGIRRYYVILMLTYYYIINRNKKLSFTNNFNNTKNNVFKNLLNHVYLMAKGNEPFEKILENLEVA